MQTKKTKTKSTLKVQLEEKKALLNDYTDHLQRLQAEFENFRKKVGRDREELVKNAHHKLIQELLTILDEFELAFKSVKEDEQFKGFKLIFDNFKTILEKEGLREIKSLNERFDPAKHEVVLREESDREDGMIVEELQRGYMLNDKVIRYAKVKISMGGKK